MVEEDEIEELGNAHSENADVEVTAIKYAAAVSRMLPESLAEHYAVPPA